MNRKRQLFFGPFRLDTQSQELFRGQEVLNLRAKSHAVLEYLVKHAGQTIGKKELLDAIWPDVMVEEGVLKVCVAEIRDILGDKRDFIETRPKRGYRFIAKISKIPPVQVKRKHPRAGRFTEDILSTDIKTMPFREEWQLIVNNVVSETERCMRAMVFDVELKRWWNSMAGRLYMITNTKVLKKGASIKRIFILSSTDRWIRRNALLTAYVHQKLGIEVKVCEAADLKEASPFKADMFSLHDDMVMAQYDLFTPPAITRIVCQGKYVSECADFYDDFFRDDKHCLVLSSALERFKTDRAFFKEAEEQIGFLESILSLSSTELLKL